VPKELVEAATVDGASPWQTLRNITLADPQAAADPRDHACR